MTKKDKKKASDLLMARGRDAVEEAVSDLRSAMKEMTADTSGDMEMAEGLVSAALLSIGEARGFFNAAHDVREEM